MAWKNIRIQGKFAIGFGAIIILLIALSIISLFNIQNIVSNAEQVIGGNKLRSTIIQREVDHLNWKAALGDFVNDENAVTLSIQTDPTQCAFGKWYYGQGRKEAEALVPQLASILRTIETPHNDLHQSAVRIKDSHSIVDPLLGNFLREKKIDHINWKLRLLDYITDRSILENPVETDHTKCSLGKWFYNGEMDSLISDHSELSALFVSLLDEHEKVHSGAILIEEMIGEGDYGEASDFFHTDLDEPFAETLGYLDELLTWHNQEMEMMSRSRSIFTTDTSQSLVQIQDHFSRMINTVNNNIMTEDVMLQSGQEAAGSLLIISVIIALIAVIAAFVLATSIIKPINKCVDFAEQISTGDLDVQLDIDQKDQVGQLCDSLRRVLSSFSDKADVLRQFADGDLTAEVTKLSDKDGLGLSLQRMKMDLSTLIGQIASSVDQISSGAEQIADASQNLSEGAATQAGSTEEVSVMVNQISGQAAQNADNAAQARSISEKATLDAEKGNQNMGDVVSIMEKINGSADETKKIVKVIDDIAFQINLLALNANVEAARAGKYGKGFAVVADEVRNLAVKSAQAARETSEMVEESIRNIQNGSNAVQVSADQLREIVDGSRKVSEILEEIAAASRSQDNGISQATSGLDQIEKVTQENTGNAEETASAAEELSSQSVQLQALVKRFKLEDSENSRKRDGVKRLTGSRASKPGRTVTAQTRTGISGKALGEETENVFKRAEPAADSREESFSTGIKPVNPSEVISLDDNDFDQF